MSKKWFDLFFENRNNLLAEMTAFDLKYKFGLIDKIKKEKVKVDFLSTISEIHFGMFFSKIAEDLQYNKPVFKGSKLTPDWKLRVNGQEIIAEVLRVNASDDDQAFLNFEDVISEGIETIELPYCIQIEYEFDEINLSEWDIEDFKNYITAWLSNGPSKNDSTNYKGLVNIEVIRTNTGINYVTQFGAFRSIKHNPTRLLGENGRFMSKVHKYGSLSIEHNIPLLVCVFMHFESWLHPEDLQDGLYGPTCEFQSRFEFDGKYPGTQYREIGKGLYYNNESVKSGVSGVLLRHKDQYSYFHNYYINNLLNLKARDLLLPVRELHSGDS